MGEGIIDPDHFVVVKADELHVFNGSELAEGQPRAPDERPHKADNKGNQRWQHKDGPVAFYGFFHRKAPFSDSLSCFVSLKKAGRAISARPTGIAF